MTNQEIKKLLTIPNKKVIRSFDWSASINSSPQLPWLLFESGIQIEGQIIEGLRFVAKYRGERIIAKNNSRITLPKKFSISIFVNTSIRAFAIDTNPGQRHINKVGKEQPYFGQAICNDTHMHIWVGTEGYVEPIEPPIHDIRKGLKWFANKCNLSYNGPIIDPIKGEQQELL